MKKIFLSMLFVMLFCGTALAGEATITLSEAKYDDDGTTVTDYNAVAAGRIISLVFTFENAKSASIEPNNFPSHWEVGETKSGDVVEKGTCAFRLQSGNSVEITVVATDSGGWDTIKTFPFKAAGVPEPEPELPSESSSSGCNAAGFSAFVLAGVAFACMRRSGER
ncbi:MAG: hypothetical protein LBQ58_04195 [Synergistaceae bacterium]|nr:hypothetical protein [Synergistaceae bacterium]